MTRAEIYDHLAQVYLGKRKKAEEKKKKQFNAWLVINIFITLIIFASATYGLSAFLAKRSGSIRDNIIYSLHHGLVRLDYNFKNSLSPEKTFSLSVAAIDASKYKTIDFTIRAKEEGTPGIVKLVITNQKNEVAYYYIRGVRLNWQEVSIPLEAFKDISDWSSIVDVSFILESWNVDKEKGIVLIDDIRFSS